MADAKLEVLLKVRDQMSAGVVRAQSRVSAFNSKVSAMKGPLLLAGAAVAGLALKFAKTGDAIDKMSTRTGLSATAVSELRFAMQQSGASIQGLEKGMKTVATVMADADQGLQTAVDAFDAVGLEVADLRGLSPDELFNTLAQAVGKITDPMEQAAAATDIFGRAGTQMIPFFEKGAEGMQELREQAHDLGIVMDQETAAKAARLTDAMSASKDVVIELSSTVGGMVAGPLSKALEAFSALPGPIRQGVAAIVALTVAAKFGLAPSLMTLTRSVIPALRGAMGRLSTIGIGGVIGAIGAIAVVGTLLWGLFQAKSRSDKLEIASDQLTQRMLELQAAAVQAGMGLADEDAALIAVAEQFQSLLDLQEEWRQSVEESGQASDEAGAAYDRYRDAVDEVAESIPALDEQLVAAGVTYDELSATLALMDPKLAQWAARFTDLVSAKSNATAAADKLVTAQDAVADASATAILNMQNEVEALFGLTEAMLANKVMTGELTVAEAAHQLAMGNTARELRDAIQEEISFQADMVRGGQTLSESLASGLLDGVPLVKSAAGQLAGAAIDQIDRAQIAARNAGIAVSGIFSGMLAGAANAARAISGVAGGTGGLPLLNTAIRKSVDLWDGLADRLTGVGATGVGPSGSGGSRAAVGMDQTAANFKTVTDAIAARAAEAAGLRKAEDALRIATDRLDLVQGLMTEARKLIQTVEDAERYKFNWLETEQARIASVSQAQSLVDTFTAHEGGIIPGPIGSPRLVSALAGEVVIPIGGGGGAASRRAPAMQVSIVINALDPLAAGDAVMRVISQLQRRGRIVEITT